MFADDVTESAVGVTRLLAGFRVHSVPAQHLASSPPCYMPGDEEALTAEVEALEHVDAWFRHDIADGVVAAFEGLPSIERSLLVLESGETLDDVGLFAVKRFAYWAVELIDASSSVLPANDWARALRELMQDIHPQKAPTASFSLSSLLDDSLRDARASLKAARDTHRGLRDAFEASIKQAWAGRFDLEGRFHATVTIDDARLQPIGDGLYRAVDADLDAAAMALEVAQSAVASAEQVVRRNLGERLRPRLSLLVAVRDGLATLDFRISRVELRRKWSGCWPTLGDGLKVRDGLHPGLHRLDGAQSVSFELASNAAVITGPNMGGKSTLLKLLGLAQWCAQHAFPIPAQTFTARLTNRLCYVGADGGSLADGLSAFGHEVRRVVEHRDEAGVFWLLDEFARGTHPAEGAQLARDFVEDRWRRGDTVIAATHFPVLASAEFAEQFQIAGLDRDAARQASAEITDDASLERVLRQSMDYRPVRRSAADNDVPRDARLVAALLGLSFGDG